MLRMAKSLNALQYVMNINNGKQNIASFLFLQRSEHWEFASIKF